MKQTLLKGAAVFVNGRLVPGDVLIGNGRFLDVRPDICPGEDVRVFNLSNKIIIPGFVDVHVHLREPGFFMKETIQTGTEAAVKSGYMALCAMPNLNPVPDSPEHLQQEIDLIRRDARIPVYPYASITAGQKGEDLVDFAALAPMVCGFSDDGHGVQNEEMMRRAMREIAKTGRFLAAHCEDNSLVRGGVIHEGVYARTHGLPGIVSESEYRPIQRDLKLLETTPCPYHVCHVSAWQSVEAIRQAKKKGLPVTCETAPHYLMLCDEDLKDEGRFKMNPPIRGEKDRDALIEGLLDGTIDMIATDHAPHTREEKSGGLLGSIMGVVGLETAFAALYTALVKPGVMGLEALLNKMCDAPRKLLGRPAAIEPGQSADLAVLDLASHGPVRPETFLSKGRATPFEGMELYGENILSMRNGEILWNRL